MIVVTAKQCEAASDRAEREGAQPLQLQLLSCRHAGAQRLPLAFSHGLSARGFASNAALSLMLNLILICFRGCYHGWFHVDKLRRDRSSTQQALGEGDSEFKAFHSIIWPTQARSPTATNQALLHFFVTSSICVNFVCVAMVTFVTVWGSGKALRGQVTRVLGYFFHFSAHIRPRLFIIATIQHLIAVSGLHNDETAHVTGWFYGLRSR